MSPATDLHWTTCAPDPLLWIRVREGLLQLLNSPAWLLPCLALITYALARRLDGPRPLAGLLAVALPLTVGGFYSPGATLLLEGWLRSQRPAPAAIPRGGPLPVVVLPGRGSQIAAVTTVRAASLLHRRLARAVYVSGDQRATAERLVALGVDPQRVSGDSCARTTWENANRTATWLRRHHPGAPVLLITDSWQQPRASRVFRRQGLAVIPISADPLLPPRQRNRMALREAAGTLLYALQGRS